MSQLSRLHLLYYTYYTQCSNFRLPLFGELSTNALILLWSKYPPCEPRHAVNLINNTCLISLGSCFSPDNVLPAPPIPLTICRPSDAWSPANCSYPTSSPCYKTCIVSPFPPVPAPVRLTSLPRRHTPRNRSRATHARRCS